MRDRTRKKRLESDSKRRKLDNLQKQGKEAHYFADTDTIINFLAEEAASGDLILVMSNGGFDNIHERLLERL